MDTLMRWLLFCPHCLNKRQVHRYNMTFKETIAPKCVSKTPSQSHFPTFLYQSMCHYINLAILIEISGTIPRGWKAADHVLDLPKTFLSIKIWPRHDLLMKIHNLFCPQRHHSPETASG